VAEFIVDVSALREMFASENGPVALEIRRRGNVVMREAKRLCPADTGTLRRSVTLEMRRESGLPVAVVGSNLKYAIYVHEGTGLYSKRGAKLIRPVNKRVLRWPTVNNSGSGRRRYKGGATAGYTFSLTSRGSPGRPFLTDALRNAKF
jgi:phage gpG-like protein